MVGPLLEAEQEVRIWKSQDFDRLANERIKQVKNNADFLGEDIRRDIARAQANFHQADVEADKYRRQKQQGTLHNEDLLQMAEEARQESLAELQRQKARIAKVEAWRSQQVQEIRSHKNRAKSGDYNGYRGLRNHDTSFHPDRFK